MNLDIGTHLTNLVQEEGALVSDLKFPSPLSVSPGKGALLMSE
ncbi:hypothetical protein ES703_76725 [subsurface metagenome]